MNTRSGNRKASLPEHSLRITPKTKGRLSRSQLRFNKLTARIMKLEKEIEKESAKLERVFGAYMDEVQPIALEHARMMMAVAALLDGFAVRTTLKVRQRESIRDMILDLCEHSFRTAEPNGEQKAVYDRWSDAGADDENRQRAEDGNAGSKRSRAKSSRRQLAAAAQARDEEETITRSLRGIYIALAKVVHPDTEIDPERKAEKDELMKQVTNAYSDKDLTTLLRLEVEWVQNESRHIDLLSDDSLKIYISALEDQIADLKHERSLLATHYRFRPVVRLAHLPERLALEALHREALRLRYANADLARFKNTLESQLPSQEIVKHIRDYAGTSLLNDTFRE